MKDSAIVTGDDKLLIGALQIAPRAPWSDIGEVLRVSAVTASRRWDRISSEGIAWITISPGMAQRESQCLAYVEIDCVLARRNEVAAELAGHELVLSVEITTGSADILLTIAARDLMSLSHYLLDHLSRTPDVLRTRARIASHIYAEGSSWRLAEFNNDQLRMLGRSALEAETEREASKSVEMTAELQHMVALLTANGRASFAELSEASGISATSVRRHVGKLLKSGMLLARTDVAAELSGSPVQVYLWADADVDGLAETARTITQLRQVRLCATVSSAPSLVLCAWLHTVEEVHRFELAIAKRLPNLRIVDRLVVLRTVKRVGRLVDSHGRAIGVVPINIWDDHLPHST